CARKDGSWFAYW
nr:immunoglobulin heavy chain junction region [Mus musculus]